MSIVHVLSSLLTSKLWEGLECLGHSTAGNRLRRSISLCSLLLWLPFLLSCSLLSPDLVWLVGTELTFTETSLNLS